MTKLGENDLGGIKHETDVTFLSQLIVDPELDAKLCKRIRCGDKLAENRRAREGFAALPRQPSGFQLCLGVTFGEIQTKADACDFAPLHQEANFSLIVQRLIEYR